MKTSTVNVVAERLPGQPWTIAETAKYLRVSERHLFKLIKDGEIKVTRLGHRVLIPDAEVVRLATGGN